MWCPKIITDQFYIRGNLTQVSFWKARNLAFLGLWNWHLAKRDWLWHLPVRNDFSESQLHPQHANNDKPCVREFSKKMSVAPGLYRLYSFLVNEDWKIRWIVFVVILVFREGQNLLLPPYFFRRGQLPLLSTSWVRLCLNNKCKIIV